MGKKKEFLSKKETVLCKDGVTRDFTFEKGSSPADDRPAKFCERNCSYYNLCKKVKSPEKDVTPIEDSLEIWCSSRTLDESYYPTDIDQVYPELFEGCIDDDPAFRLSEIKEKVCPAWCMEYEEGKECKNCVPGNKMCIISVIISNRKKKEDGE